MEKIIDIKLLPDFNKPEFYSTFLKYLLNAEQKKISQLKEGDVCIYFESWSDPYRNGEKIEYEECLELVFGVLKNPNSLLFSEAFSLNSYTGYLSFYDNDFAWASGVRIKNRYVIPINYFVYDHILTQLNPDEWQSNSTYDKKNIIKFANLLVSNLPSGKTPLNKEESEENVYEKQRLSKLISKFEDIDFYKNLIDILLDQPETSVDELKNHDGCIYFNLWKEQYRVGNKIEVEEHIEMIAGVVDKPKPLTFSEAYILNTFNGSLTYSNSRITWSTGSRSDIKQVVRFDHHLMHRLKVLLKTHLWEKDQSYDKKHIVPFVRTFENYFNGKFLGKNFKIVKREVLVEPSANNRAIISIDVEAPEIATEAYPGQFVVLRLHERGERIPLTIAEMKREEGLIRLIFQVIGRTTMELSTLQEGDYILDLLGPLGNPVKIEKYDKPVICIGGGVGVASIYAKTKALKEAGNHVISIIGAQNKDMLILKEEMAEASSEFYVITDDGMFKKYEDGREGFYMQRRNGEKVYGGFVTHILEALIGKTNLIDKANRTIADPDKQFIKYGPPEIFNKYKPLGIAEVIAVGPLPMMAAVVNVTACNGKYDPLHHYDKLGKPGCESIKTIVSLNPIMIDGTGMCGGCRVRIYNPEIATFEAKFACVDGPCFNGHLVDFISLFKRSIQYKIEESQSAELLEVIGW